MRSLRKQGTGTGRRRRNISLLRTRNDPCLMRTVRSHQMRVFETTTNRALLKRVIGNESDHLGGRTTPYGVFRSLFAAYRANTKLRIDRSCRITKPMMLNIPCMFATNPKSRIRIAPTMRTRLLSTRKLPEIVSKPKMTRKTPATPTGP